jgi:hypothetical protein
MSIEIDVGNRWQDEMKLAKRIARIVVSYGDEGCVQKENGSYRLDRGNDWFMSPVKNGIVTVNYRYWHNQLDSEIQNHLKETIQHFVGEKK